MNDGFGDWRIAHVTTLAKDVPPAFPGGPSHKAGTPVYVSSLAKHNKHQYLGFVTPHATALALSTSLKSADQAARLRTTLAVHDSLTPYGEGKTIANENLPHLYDFFEHCMITSSFALLSLETFANWKISLIEDPKVTLIRQSDTVELEGQEIERKASIGEKLSQVLPYLLKFPSPKGMKVWEGFVVLRRIRDATIHMKSPDMFTRHHVDKDSLYYQLLNIDPLRYPQAAHDMIAWFLPDRESPRWLTAFHNMLAKQ